MKYRNKMADSPNRTSPLQAVGYYYAFNVLLLMVVGHSYLSHVPNGTSVAGWMVTLLAFTANFAMQYRVQASVGSGGGERVSISPASPDGYYTQGTVLTSTNAVDWTNRGTITLKSLFAAATDSEQLIVVGIEGIILRSQVVPNLTPVSILSYSRFESDDSTTVNNLFLFGGEADQQFTLDSRLAFDTNTWVTGLRLEFYDGSDTFYYLETMPATNAPPQRFYRGTLTP